MCAIFRDGGTAALNFFPNVMLKQLRFKTLVEQFPREAYKMLYFYFNPPPPIRNSAPPSLILIDAKFVPIKLLFACYKTITLESDGWTYYRTLNDFRQLEASSFDREVILKMSKTINSFRFSNS